MAEKVTFEISSMNDEIRESTYSNARSSMTGSSETGLRCCRTVIVISGLVGAGKTTVSRMLFNVFTQKGYRIHSVNFTAFPNISYLFFKLISAFLLGIKNVKEHEELNIHPSSLFKLRIRHAPKPLMKLIELVEMFSMSLSFLLIEIKMKLLKKNIIIIDEGIINAVANYLEVLGKDSSELIAFAYRHLERLRRNYCLVIVFLVADLRELVIRWIKRGYPRPNALFSLKHHIKYNLYLLISAKFFSQFFNIVFEDTSRTTPISVASRVIEIIENKIR